jgi:hypothetical protein
MRAKLDLAVPITSYAIIIHQRSTGAPRAVLTSFGDCIRSAQKLVQQITIGAGYI